MSLQVFAKFDYNLKSGGKLAVCLTDEGICLQDDKSISPLHNLFMNNINKSKKYKQKIVRSGVGLFDVLPVDPDYITTLEKENNKLKSVTDLLNKQNAKLTRDIDDRISELEQLNNKCTLAINDLEISLSEKVSLELQLAEEIEKSKKLQGVIYDKEIKTVQAEILHNKLKNSIQVLSELLNKEYIIDASTNLTGIKWFNMQLGDMAGILTPQECNVIRNNNEEDLLNIGIDVRRQVLNILAKVCNYYNTGIYMKIINRYRSNKYDRKLGFVSDFFQTFVEAYELTKDDLMKPNPLITKSIKSLQMGLVRHSIFSGFTYKNVMNKIIGNEQLIDEEIQKSNERKMIYNSLMDRRCKEKQKKEKERLNNIFDWI